MAIRFSDQAARNDLGRRLIALSEYMQRSFDQGTDGRIAVGDEMIHDVKAAAVCVLCADLVNM